MLLPRLNSEAAERIAELRQRQAKPEEAAAWAALSNLETFALRFAPPESTRKAAETAQVAVSAWESLCQKQPERLDWATYRGVSCRALARSLRESGRAQESLPWYDKAEQALWHGLYISQVRTDVHAVLGCCGRTPPAPP